MPGPLVSPDRLDALIDVMGQPLVDPANRTHWLGLGCFLVVVLVVWLVRRPPSWTLARGWQVLRHPSTELDVQIYLGRQLLRFFTGAPAAGAAWWLATHEVRLLDELLGQPAETALSPLAVSLLYSAVLFVSWDASRWALHSLAHTVPLLWEFHQVHHSAEVMTPLSFHRIHPVESLLAGLRGALVTGVVAGLFYWRFRGGVEHLTLLGVPALGFLLNVLTGNLRHSHVWIRYPRWLERWLLSPAQHQIHHAAEPRLCHSNYGTWLAVWDRLAGTLHTAEVRPTVYGIPPETRNHGNDLLSAWLGPFGAVLRLRPGGGAAWRGDRADPSPR